MNITREHRSFGLASDPIRASKLTTTLHAPGSLVMSGKRVPRTQTHKRAGRSRAPVPPFSSVYYYLRCTHSTLCRLFRSTRLNLGVSLGTANQTLRL